MRRGFLLSVLAIFLTIKGFAQLSTGDIAGTITTDDGKPVEGANVSIVQLKKHTVTTKEGYFHFKKIPQGTYTLHYSFAGEASGDVTVTVPPTEGVTTTYRLPLNTSELEEVIILGSKNINSRVAKIGKSNIPVMDLPQSISSIGETTLKNIQAQRLSDVMKNVNGVYLGTARGATQETFWARGYNISTNNMFKNGFRINNGAMPEISGIESVEFLKGNAALLYGNVAPGGIVNMITKKPKFNFGGEFSMRLGSFDLYKPSVDIYGPLSRNIAYRVNGTYEKANSFRDKVHSERFYINPSLLFKIGKKTDLLVQGDYLKHNFTPDFGIGTISEKNDTTTFGGKIIPDVPRSRFMGADWQYAKTKQNTVSTELNHNINNNWQLNAGASYQNYNRDYYSIERVQGNSKGKWRRPLGKFNNNEDYYIAQANLNGNFNTGTINHKLLVGVDAEKYVQVNFASDITGKIYDSINLLNPLMYTRRTDIPAAQWQTRAVIPITRLGAFFQDLISISQKVKILAGLRWSYVQANPTRTTYLLKKDSLGFGKIQIDKAFSPKLGIVYQPSTSTSLFASYSNSFAPNTGTDIYMNALPPSIIDQYELGAKQNWLHGKLSTNLTFYHIVNNNLAQTAMVDAKGNDNSNTNIKSLTGETTSKGFEIDIQGHPLNGLDIIAGYSYNDMRYTKTTIAVGSFVEGQRLVNTPAHTGNLTGFYTFCDGSLKGLKLGAGYYYTGKRNAGWNNDYIDTKGTIRERLFEVKGFSTVDVTAGYTYKKWSLLAKLANITNTYNYYVHENYSINPIAPRNFVVTAAFKF